MSCKSPRKTGMKFLFGNCFGSDLVVLLIKIDYLIVNRLMKFPDRPYILWFLGSDEIFNGHKRWLKLFSHNKF